MSSSAVAGYLTPDAPPAPVPLEGEPLNNFLQQVVVGITTLDGKLVRPRWQAAPPNIPDAFTVWAAVGVNERPNDPLPAVVHFPENDGYDQLQRNEELTMLVSFYDTGTNGQADKYAAILRDGLAIAQNRETMQRNGFFLIECLEPQPVPTLLKERWLYRVDMVVRLRRLILRNYPIRNLESFGGTITAEIRQTVVTVPFKSKEP